MQVVGFVLFKSFAVALIAVGEIWEAFAQLSESEFLSKYGFFKPRKSSQIGLLCLRGKRALDASDKLLLLGDIHKPCGKK